MASKTLMDKILAIRPEYMTAIISAAEQLQAQELGDEDMAPMETAQDGTTMVIPIKGMIMPEPNILLKLLGGTALSDLETALDMAESSNEITNVVLEMDSPGGAVTGVSRVADKIASMSTDIETLVVGDSASAAYWLASQTDRITVDKTSAVGSIGVVASFSRDDGEEIQILSSNAPNKRPNPETESGQSQIQAQLDSIANVFLGAVSSGRNMSRDEVISAGKQGGVVIGQEAIDAGLADAIGTLDDLLATDGPNVALQAAAEDYNTQTTKEDMMSDEMTLEMLQQHYPELCNQLKQDGIKAERERMLAIDDLYMEGYEDLIKEAKADGTDSSKLAIKMIQQHKQEQSQELKRLEGSAQEAVEETEPQADHETETIDPASLDIHSEQDQERLTRMFDKRSDWQDIFGDAETMINCLQIGYKLEDYL